MARSLSPQANHPPPVVCPPASQMGDVRPRARCTANVSALRVGRASALACPGTVAQMCTVLGTGQSSVTRGKAKLPMRAPSCDCAGVRGRESRALACPQMNQGWGSTAERGLFVDPPPPVQCRLGLANPRPRGLPECPRVPGTQGGGGRGLPGRGPKLRQKMSRSRHLWRRSALAECPRMLGTFGHVFAGGGGVRYLGAPA